MGGATSRKQCGRCLLARSAWSLAGVEAAQVSSLQLHYRYELRRPREPKE